MIVSKSNISKLGFSTALALAFLVSAPAMSVQQQGTQDVQDDQAKPQDQKAKKSEGPDVGKPASIVPSPYFRKGTIKLQPRTKRVQDTQESGLSLPEDTANTISALQREAIVEDTLIQLDPSGIAATVDDASEPSIFWGDYDRVKIRAKIDTLHPSGPLPSIHHLAEKFVRYSQILPAPESDGDITNFIKTRLAALRRFGNGSAYVELVNRLPKDRDWSAIDRFRSEAALVSGKLVEACTIAAQQSNETSEAYWLKMNALCYAIDGNRAGVDFQIGILEETSTLSPVYYKLIDQLLIEAEQSSGPADDSDVGIASIDIFEPFPVAILEASMARLTGATISDLAPENPDPLAIPMLISQPGLSREARVELIELGVKQNWVDAILLEEFVRTLDISVDEEALAFRMYDVDDRFLIDLALARQMANKENTIEDRMQAFKLAAERSARLNTTAGLAQLHLNLISDIRPSGELLSYAATIGRHALLTGNFDQASTWFSLARSLPAGSDSDSDRAIVSLWPLLIVAGHDDDLPDVSENILTFWWSAMGDNPDRFDKAARLFSVLEGLSYTIPDVAWQWLEDGPSGVAGQAISPAHWRRFLTASHEANQIDIHLALLPLFENDEPTEPALLGSVVGTLADRGETRLARDIALEALLHAGL